MTRLFFVEKVVCFLLAALFVSLPDICASQTSAAEEKRQVYPPDSSQHSIASTVCSIGTTSELEMSGISRSAHHNGNDGEARFKLLSRDSPQTVLWSSVYVGEGVCLGFNPHTHRHLFGIVREHGIGARLTELFYLDETTRMVETSAFDKAEIEAFSAVPGPSGRFIALIGLHRNDIALYVVDIEKDTIRELGKAPLPPPLNRDERDVVRQHPEFLEGTWDWLVSFRDGYMQLDAGIIVFRNKSALQVSYGDDTPYGRAEQRRVTMFALASDDSGQH